jgi:hypothetical protein
VGEIEPAGMRISDTEREQAVRMLGEHMSVGRLDVEEYGERSARATAAKTRGELSALFTDLPEPKPTFEPVAPPARPAPDAPATRRDDRPLSQRVWAAMVPLSAILALILFLSLVKVWFIFMLPVAVAVIGGAIWGDDSRHHRRDWDRRMRHRQLRRGWHD